MAAILLWASVLLACGGADPGAPGSWGTEETNTKVTAEVTPEEGSVDTCSTSAVSATGDIATEKVNQDLPDNTLHLEGYGVEFSALTGGAPPLGGFTVAKTGVLPVSGMALRFVDANTKAEYLAALASGGFSPEEDFPSYSAEYTFHGRDDYGSGFGTVARVTFSIGNFGTCPLSLMPGALSVTGLPNPDGDPSDDIQFVVNGGTGPYTIYSDNISVVASPGSLGPGVATFTADPDSVTTPTVVTLTVVDSASATSTAEITVNPL